MFDISSGNSITSGAILKVVASEIKVTEYKQLAPVVENSPTKESISKVVQTFIMV